jgi:heterodisulfide reductase subunit C
MPIHEKHLIRPENLLTQEKLVLDGVDVSGHWSTFIAPRVVTDYNERMEEEIASLPGGEHIHRCWQCGSCTNSCTVNAINPEFNPRFWIYLVRMGMEAELMRDKDIIWQCVSCHKCTYACPRDVNPEGVMKATSHWLALKSHTPKSPSLIFDEAFTSQVVQHGRIEEGRLIETFFRRTGQPLVQDWLVALIKRLIRHLPVKLLSALAIARLRHPRTRRWGAVCGAITEYLHEQEEKRRTALRIDPSAPPAPDAQVPQRRLDRKALIDALRN